MQQPKRFSIKEMNLGRLRQNISETDVKSLRMQCSVWKKAYFRIASSSAWQHCEINDSQQHNFQKPDSEKKKTQRSYLQSFFLNQRRSVLFLEPPPISSSKKKETRMGYVKSDSKTYKTGLRFFLVFTPRPPLLMKRSRGYFSTISGLKILRDSKEFCK